MTIEILRLRKERENDKEWDRRNKGARKNSRFRGKKREKEDDKRRKEMYKCDGFGSLEIANFL